MGRLRGAHLTMGNSQNVLEVSKGAEEYVVIGGKCFDGSITGVSMG